MGRSKKGFDRILSFYKYKDTVFRMSKIPLVNLLGRRVIDANNLTLTYIPICEGIELPEGTVLPISIIEEFIERACHHVILDRCPCRSENGCKEFDPYFGCTFIGEGAKEINPEVGRHVTKDEALRHLREATQAGLVSCVGKFKGDAIMLGVKDHHRMMTICHCCPCCCISTSIHLASKHARDLLVKLEGLKVEVNENCNGCARCVEACIFKQIKVFNGRAVIGEECKGCGRCAMVCKRNAISVSIDNPRYVQACMDRINAMVSIE